MHWFGVPGIANGLAVMRDEESKSLWDHITGECFEGPMEGARMEFWPVSMTSVAAELARDPDAILLKSDFRSLASRLMTTAASVGLSAHNKGTVLAPHFRKSMAIEIDSRLPEGEQGLGIMTDDFVGRFYPVRLLQDGPIEDTWQGRALRVELGEIDRIPFATFTDTGALPMQLLTRWYGFAFTCPGCGIYRA
ncbi:MAG: hypothetical protein ACI8RZ_000710 [Myxococcota bacterium]